MVFEMRRSIKNRGNPKNLRCKSADSGVSVALNEAFKDHNIKSPIKINDFEEEHLDFEPDFEERIGQELEDTSQSQCELDQPQTHIYSDQSTVKNFNLDSSDIDTNDSYSVSNCVSIGHGRDMLPVPHTDAKDGRQYQYLPVYYAPSSVTTLDSSSDDEESETERSDTSVQNQNYQSGYENDENSSTYSITQEEEDKLLDGSEEEESEQDTFVIQTGSVETCQIGNARITLPTFFSNSHTFQNNDLKRTKSTVKLKGGKEKKKKWDIAYKPEYPPTQLFLKDIGYISEEEDDNTTNEGCESNSNLPKLIVICNKNKITCEELQGNSQRGLVSLPTNDDSFFKLPLPPPKRPPTRPKRTVCNSEGAGQNLQIKFSNKDEHPLKTTPISLRKQNVTHSFEDADSDVDKDDTLSIVASSIDEDHNENEDIENLDSLEEENHTDFYENHNYVDDRVQEWIQNVSTPIGPSNSPNLLNPPVQNVPQQNYQGGVTIVPPLPARGNPHVNFKNIPNVFGGLCYLYYFNDKCTRNQYCSMAHSVSQERFVYRFQRRSPDELFKAFQFAMPFGKLFRDSYPAFISAFGLLKMQNELITSIKYVLQMKYVDCTEVIKHIVAALEQSGLSFQEAIEMISFNIGFLEHPVLADILLDLITRNPNISENWEVIKRIARAKGKVLPITAKKILSTVINAYPLNDELCLDIYNLFVKNNMTDLSQINEDILAPYKVLAGFRDAIPVIRNTTTKSPTGKIQPVTVPNPQDLLAAHIDNNLIKERERYEREVEGTTITTLNNRVLNEESMSPARNYNYDVRQMSPFDNLSQSSNSEEQPTLSPVQNMFAKRDCPALNVPATSQYLSNNVFSAVTPSTSTSAIDADSCDPDAALNFQPPSDISEYVPGYIKRDETSNEHQEADITLTPIRPIFGRPCYRNDFTFKNSLHNLLPDSTEHVNINEKDVANLNTVIKTRNGFEFYKILQYYKKPPTIQNFITMTIVNLKSSDNIYDSVIGLIKSLELVKSDYAKDRKIKAIFEVIVMNLLFELQRKGQWDAAKSLLELFCDWDSLVSSKIFSQSTVTHMGRYIFLSKIFAKAKSFHFTYEILLSPDLKLLGSPETWPYFHNSQIDLESRNAVLSEFLKHGYRYYIIGVSDFYRRNYKYGKIYGFDVHVHFNPMLISMINDLQKPLLKYFYPDIDTYYKVMDKNVLRAFVIMLSDQFTQETLFRLYELCCSRHIYTLYTGAENNITIRNNLYDIELKLILSYYFFKMSKNRQLPTGNVMIQIKLLENKPVYPKMLQRCVRSIKEVNEKVKKILRDNFRITLNETHTEQLTVIEVPHEEIEKWLQCNQRWFPIL